MAIEQERGCGYRKVNALYLVGGYIPVACDRMPLPIGACPVCGHGLHFTRSMTEIDPLKLWGIHQPCKDAPTCVMCYPPNFNDTVGHYVMTVGKKYYSPQSFLEEATRIGICKRIPFIPKKLVFGSSVIYLAHPEAVEIRESPVMQEVLGILEDAEGGGQRRLLEAERKPHKAMGIFCAFGPQRIEKLIKESDATPEEVEKLKKRGITPIKVPDNDLDHMEI